MLRPVLAKARRKDFGVRRNLEAVVHLVVKLDGIFIGHDLRPSEGRIPHRGRSQPSRRSSTARVRPLMRLPRTPHFASTFEMCVFTVATVIPSSSAISARV